MGREEDEMVNYYLAEQIAKDRLDEAREMARQARLVGNSAPEPVRVVLGLALIRAGRYLAGHAAKGSAHPRRVPA